MTALPRSARLALWAAPVLAGRAPLDALLAAVQGDDEPHAVDAQEADGLDVWPGPTSLRELVAALRERGVHGLRLVLPVPGDPAGLPGPAAVNEAALDAGECVVTVGGPPLALVPDVVEFGSAYELGHQVTWHVLACSPALAPPVTSAGDAERELRQALLIATDVLTALDVGRWRPDAAEQVAALRRPAPTGALPSTCSSRAVRVIDLAWRVRSIVELAREDDGAAVSGWEASRRADELRGLDAVSRRALVAAVNDGEPVSA
ncbi:MAG TPA: hypothetical protein VHO27_15545 [Angustibacter sp.]|nr:hypothetical protein [Angustibacter sp.]